MKAQDRLLELLGETSFRILEDDASLGEFLEITRHNEEQYAGIEARGEPYKERLRDLVCMVLAEVFHPLAREGDKGDEVNHQLFR